MKTISAILISAFTLAASADFAAASEKIVIVLNNENGVSSLSTAEIRDYFLKRKTQWPDGTPVRFIDWEEGSAVRAAFLEQVVKKSPRELELYWIGEKLYRGNSAPIKVDSPEMVLTFVAKLAGAIGYVPEEGTAHSAKVKRIELTESQ
jgi:ABC-type phosphate transport system substrate-binding protein